MLSKESTVKELDLEYLEARLMDKQKWSLETTREAIRRYKNFLMLLVRYPDQTLAPASDMDEVWHAHILFTREYTRDSQRIFGGYLHHAPARNGGSEDEHVMKEAQQRTSRLYTQEFDECYSPELDVSTLW